MAESCTPELTSRPATSGGTVRAIFLFAFTAPWSAFWGTWILFFALLNAQRACQFGLDTWARGIMACSGVRLVVTHRAPLDPARTYVFLCNHQSALDIPILMKACFPTFNVRFLAKESLFKIPIMGWAMGRSGFVPIRRESPRHSAELFQAMTKVGKVPYSYIIFPEGTRSPDGRLQPFKKGSIGLALRLGLPVVPVSLIDACRANPKGKYRVRPGAVNVVFHTPIEPATDAGSQRDSRDALEERVYGAIYSALPEDQRPAASMELGKKS